MRAYRRATLLLINPGLSRSRCNLALTDDATPREKNINYGARREEAQFLDDRQRRPSNQCRIHSIDVIYVEIR